MQAQTFGIQQWTNGQQQRAVSLINEGSGTGIIREARQDQLLDRDLQSATQLTSAVSEGCRQWGACFSDHWGSPASVCQIQSLIVVVQSSLPV